MKYLLAVTIGFLLSGKAFSAFQCEGKEEPRTVLSMSIAPTHSFDYMPVDNTLPRSRAVFKKNTMKGSHVFELVDLAQTNPKRNVYLELQREFYKKNPFLGTRLEVTERESGSMETVKRVFLCHDISI